MRAMSISISETSAAGGFIMPGDYVDVVLTANIRSAVDSNKAAVTRFDFPDGDTIINFTSETVLENVKVLAIDQSLGQNTTEQGPAKVGRTATLEVTPHDASRLLIASQLGNLTLTLRSIVTEPETAESKAAAEDPFFFTSDTSSSRTLAAITNYMSKAGQPMPKPKVEEPQAAPPAPPVEAGGTIRINRGGNIQEQSVGQ
jgi:pilus assembly protein CpaB